MSEDPSRVNDPDATSHDFGQIKILSDRVVYSNAYGALYDDDVRFPSGKVGRYIRFVWSAPYSVAVLPILTDGRIVLQKCYRHALREWSIEVVKGFGHEGWEPEETAAQELAEEMGLYSESIERITTVVTDPGFVAHPTVLLVAPDCVSTGNRHLEDTESILSLAPLDLDAVNELVVGGSVVDAVSLVLITRYLSAHAR